MALRVLLADESSTIKKVMQLALADFGVEVKSVPVGLDVLQVATSFKPDIIFADVLLTKRSGYEVCADLKGNKDTAHIPVVLMWSGFMEIDEAKATECKADRRLEKPFDADFLRSIVSDVVQKTKSNPVSNYVTFPEMPEFEETPALASVPVESSFNKIPEINQIPELDEIDDISALPSLEEIPTMDDDLSLGAIENIPSLDSSAYAGEIMVDPLHEIDPDDGGWAHQDLSKFKIEIPKDSDNDSQNFSAKYVIPQDNSDEDFEEIPQTPASNDNFLGNIKKQVENQASRTVSEQMMETLKKSSSKAPSNASSKAQNNPQSKVDLNVDLVEKVIREEAREVIEAICWKILPDIAERAVRAEINRILRETEKSI